MMSMVKNITKATFPGAGKKRLISLEFADANERENFIRETIKRAAQAIDIRDLVDEVCGEWAVETPIGFATALQNRIIDTMINEANK